MVNKNVKGKSIIFSRKSWESLGKVTGHKETDLYEVITVPNNA